MADPTKDPMEYIWERVPKNKEGYIVYLRGDIPYLYKNGFVDTNQFTYKEWKEAFEDCIQEDETYLVSHEKFLSLRKFRYIGPVFEPFDPQKVREGEWTDDDLKKLYVRSLKPSSTIPEEVYWANVKALKDQGLVKNGNLVISKEVKTQLAYLIERFPTPRRRLEKEVSRIRQERESEYRAVTKNRDSSKFITGTLESENKMDKFKSLQSKEVPQKSIPAKPTNEAKIESIDIKKLKKPPKKISG